MNRAVSIVAIGDELLIGQVVDTNSGELARIMEPHGWTVDNVQTVHDDAVAIRRAIETAFALTDVVITTGGLGPTKDDITKQVMCDYFGGTLRLDPEVLENVKRVFCRRGLKLNKLTESQAMVPTSCRVVQNLVGTAPIMWFDKAPGKVLVALPGVPFEAIQMFRGEVFPQLLKRYPSDECVARKTLVFTGITESDLAERLDPIERSLPPFVHFAYLPKQGVIRLRIDGKHTDQALLTSTLDDLSSRLATDLADYLLADSDMEPEEIVIAEARRLGLTVASAESCSGGNIAHRITMIAGCSDVYRGSVVAYANEVKVNVLGVDEKLIEEFGVVSEPVVREMAEGVCRAIGTDCAMTTSGIAGPGGGTEKKPVGTVCIGIRTPRGTTTHTFHFPGTRDRVIDRTSTTALTLLAAALRHF